MNTHFIRSGSSSLIHVPGSENFPPDTLCFLQESARNILRKHPTINFVEIVPGPQPQSQYLVNGVPVSGIAILSHMGNGPLVTLLPDNCKPRPRCTPGPWTFAFGAVYQCEEGCAVDADISIRLLLADRNEDKTTPCERDANCRLAAFAPELRDTLVQLLDWLDGDRLPDVEDKRGQDIFHKAAAIINSLQQGGCL